jgi:hypothetical protein
MRSSAKTPPPDPLPEAERGSKQRSGSPPRFGEGRGEGFWLSR